MGRTSEMRDIPARVRRPARDDVRSRLVAVAIEVFERDGFAGASVAVIAEEARFSRGAVYSNFTGKEELFLAALEQNARDRVDSLLTVHPNLLAGGANLQSISQALTLTRGWSLLFIEFCLHAQYHPEWREQLQATRLRMRADVVQHLVDAIGLDPEGKDLDMIAVIMMALNNGIMIEMLSDPSLDPKSFGGVFATVLNQLGEQ